MLNAFLLYNNREFDSTDAYQDSSSVMTDLGLNVLFKNASISRQARAQAAKKPSEEDLEIQRAMKRIMMIPLKTNEEILYRQRILKDFLQNPGFVEALYGVVDDVIRKWRKLGKEQSQKGANKYAVGNLIFELRLLDIFLDALSEIRSLCFQNVDSFHSDGMKRFCDMIFRDYDKDWEANVHSVMDDLSFFYNDEPEEVKHYYNKYTEGRMVLECSVGSGFKPENIKLEQIQSKEVPIRRHVASTTVLERLKMAVSSEPMISVTDDQTWQYLEELKTSTVAYVYQYMEGFAANCKKFFEVLQVQSAFYLGCVNLYERCGSIGVPLCFPTVCGKENMQFDNLVELSMALHTRRIPVDNSCDFEDKMLLIVTGANQGGKSTFLRSVGIAQIMMQCGMFVGAKRFASGIFQHMFTHFVRREDVAMNSGRLDEELGRIHKIAEGLRPDSLVLLNESFATTTEEEGSEIAYDIIKAFTEVGVKVMTVTHLLTFAQRMYEENPPKVVFLSAERQDDGRRTYKMVAGKPQNTSFGLDLYNKVVEQRDNS